MEAPVEAAPPQVGERLPAALDQRNRDVGVAAGPHDLAAEHEPVPVLDDADRNAELDRLAGLARGDPAGVLLENREHLLPVRNLLLSENAALDLVREAAHMGGEPGDPVRNRLGAARALQRLQRALGLAGQRQARLQIGPDGIRTGALQRRRPHGVEQNADRALPMPPLAPSGNAERPAGPRRLPNQAKGRIPKQIDIGRIVDVRLHHERVTAPDQRCAKLFSRDLVARPDNQIAHLAEKLRRRKSHIVPDVLKLVAAGVEPDVVAQERLDVRMPVHDLPETVEVAPEALLQNAHHQNPPQVHPRAAGGPAAARKHVRLQKAEQLRPRRLVQVDRLNPDQERRDVVPRIRVQLDRPDAGRAQKGPLRNHFPHAEILRKF